MVNVAGTLAEFLGVENKNAILPKLKKELDKGYKNVVCMCWDGMGTIPLRQHLDKKDYLRANTKMRLTSTFPSATANATTTLTANLLPLEHGWIASSTYFEDINLNIDLFKRRDTQTREHVDYQLPLYDNELCFFDVANSEYEVNVVVPDYFDTKSVDKKIVITNEVELFDEVEKVCQKAGKQFVYTYLNDPDSTMHKYGMSSKEAGEKIRYINDRSEELYHKLDDTLWIIMSDHGHIDVTGYVDFYKDTELNDMLKYIPHMDSRAPAFWVKEGKKQEFAQKFRQRYAKDFVLVETEKLIKKGIFGNRGKYTYLLGDYIALGTRTYKQFVTHESMKRLKGNHSGPTDEMWIDLIWIGKK